MANQLHQVQQTLIRLNLTPQTRVLTTQRDKILFRIPEECPENCGQPRRNRKAELIEVETKGGKTKMVRYGCKHSLSLEGLLRKKRIEHYNEYKAALLAESKIKGFVFPDYNTDITFFLPVSPSWTQKKKKSLHLKLHRQRPDTDNLLKALQDGLMGEDCAMAHLSGLAKRWVYADSGYIEIIITDGPEPEYKPFKERAKEILAKIY